MLKVNPHYEKLPGSYLFAEIARRVKEYGQEHPDAQLIRLGKSGAAPGVYHGTNSGQTSWFGFTRRIFELVGADPHRVQPTTTEAFPRPAPRPAFSVLGHDRWAREGLSEMRAWDEALAEALPAIVASVGA